MNDLYGLKFFGGVKRYMIFLVHGKDSWKTDPKDCYSLIIRPLVLVAMVNRILPLDNQGDVDVIKEAEPCGLQLQTKLRSTTI